MFEAWDTSWTERFERFVCIPYYRDGEIHADEPFVHPKRCHHPFICINVLVRVRRAIVFGYIWDHCWMGYLVLQELQAECRAGAWSVHAGKASVLHGLLGVVQVVVSLAISIVLPLIVPCRLWNIWLLHRVCVCGLLGWRVRIQMLQRVWVYPMFRCCLGILVLWLWSLSENSFEVMVVRVERRLLYEEWDVWHAFHEGKLASHHLFLGRRHACAWRPCICLYSLRLWLCSTIN